MGWVPTGPMTQTLIPYWDRLAVKTEDGRVEKEHTLSENSTSIPEAVHSCFQTPNDSAGMRVLGQEML